DSHAHQWSSVLIQIARARGWELHLYVKGGCDFSRVRWSDVSDTNQRRCAIWNDDVDRSLEAEAPYTLVFTAARADLRGRPVGADHDRAAQRGYRASWDPVITRGATVLAIRDTPAGDRCATLPRRESGCCLPLSIEHRTSVRGEGLPRCCGAAHPRCTGAGSD
ncbi:SGNH hydrolase domain-containing protein, partial [Streptomyces rochei]|uniref:SGNH hydrolase domain-containing protein n=1 Tax=Streptomyces rochei TaxID=1928 RepID=UPI0034D732C4